MSVVIASVEPGSVAAKSGISAGDLLISLNGHEIVDVLDYRFFQQDAKIAVCYLRADGKKCIKTLHKAEDEELGFLFETYLMDKQRACKNRCIFCFIDQLPRGMRKSLYFKDDDSRLSFLFGNYITLTNITEHEIERIIAMHISPVNISVHTTNPELRVRMMRNPDAGRVLEIMKRFDEAGIAMNCQLVLCPGYNDGEELYRSLRDLTALSHVENIAAVPVGLTDHREGLEPLHCFTRETAAAVIDIIDEFSPRGRVCAADEFFLLAGRPIPEADYYGDFCQLENGVGLWRLMHDESCEALENTKPPQNATKISIATGVAAYPLISNIVDTAAETWHNLNCKVYAIKNDFFGNNITVTGLVTGTDIIKQLSGKELGDCLLIPDVMLRHEKDCFLDDVTVEQVSEALGVRVKVIQSDGGSFIAALKGE